jgi:hypothetical protein
MTEKARWFKYEILASAVFPVALTGSFDMLEVFWVEGSQRDGGPRKWVLRLRSTQAPLILDESNFQKYCVAVDAYWVAREKL